MPPPQPYFINALKAQDSATEVMSPEINKVGCNLDFLNDDDVFDEDMKRLRKKSHTFSNINRGKYANMNITNNSNTQLS